MVGDVDRYDCEHGDDVEPDEEESASLAND